MSTDAPSGVLDCYKVLDFTQYVAGPTVTLMMAEMGAEVIKVELAPGGDKTRLAPMQVNGRSGYYVQHNRGKKSLCVDPKTPEGLAILKALVAKVDVVVENFAPGVIARMGLGWETIKSINPRAIMCSVSAFGQTGPLSSQPGFDSLCPALSRAERPRPIPRSVATGYLLSLPRSERADTQSEQRRIQADALGTAQLLSRAGRSIQGAQWPHHYHVPDGPYLRLLVQRDGPAGAGARLALHGQPIAGEKLRGAGGRNRALDRFAAERRGRARRDARASRALRASALGGRGDQPSASARARHHPQSARPDTRRVRAARFRAALFGL